MKLLGFIVPTIIAVLIGGFLFLTISGFNPLKSKGKPVILCGAETCQIRFLGPCILVSERKIVCDNSEIKATKDWNLQLVE